MESDFTEPILLEIPLTQNIHHSSLDFVIHIVFGLTGIMTFFFSFHYMHITHM